MDTKARALFSILKISFLIQWVYLYYLVSQKEYLWVAVWVYSCLVVGATIGKTMENTALGIVVQNKK